MSTSTMIKEWPITVELDRMGPSYNGLKLQHQTHSWNIPFEDMWVESCPISCNHQLWPPPHYLETWGWGCLGDDPLYFITNSGIGWCPVRSYMIMQVNVTIKKNDSWKEESFNESKHILWELYPSFILMPLQTGLAIAHTFWAPP